MAAASGMRATEVDIARALRGAAMINEAPGVLVVKADNPARDLADFIARAKAVPGQFVMGSGPAGTTTHIIGLHFANRAGARFEHLPYPAGSQAMRDVLGGRVTSMFDIAVTAIPQIRGGAVRGLGVSSPVRLTAAPELPTLVEGGLADFIAGTWNSIALPAGTPDAIIARVNALMNEVVQAETMRARLGELGSFVPAAMSPAEVDAYYARERETWIPVVRATGARQS
jgi:tripartite-type tricarboxylate transporter receptor subunit TctC